MTYTDEEVAALREKCTNTTGRYYTTIDFDRGIALLDRLEAAEKAVEYADGCDKGEIDSCVMRLAIKEWRKAAGK